jgi:acyl-CoA thioester hydrolase
VAPPWAPRIYHCGIDPAWIDYNRHLRDGYYTVIASAAIDALMDDLGLDADYRQQTQCTLYTLEMHVRFLREVKADARLALESFPVEFDAKRLRLLIAMRAAGADDVAAVVDSMLMHVHQGESVRSEPFPAAVRDRLASWSTRPVDPGLLALGSRALTTRRGP